MISKKRENTFKRFTQEMNDLFRSEEFNNSVNGRDQKRMLGDLFALERQFRAILIETSEGRKVYGAFLKYIISSRRNILSSRIFFREKQDVFSAKIAPIFKAQRAHKLYKFRINYQFMKWVLSWYEGANVERLREVYDRVIHLRKTLCEQNLPLAINRAKIFWSKAPSNTLDYMDLIQASAEGLMTAIDKFVPPYRTVFRSVAIGRMLLNMMEGSNATLVRLPPKERRVLYRAKKATLSKKLSEDSEVLGFVQESFKDVTLNTLNKIILASQQSYDIEEKGGFLSDGSDSVEIMVEQKEIVEKFWAAIRSLCLIDQKILFLKYGFSDPSLE